MAAGIAVSGAILAGTMAAPAALAAQSIHLLETGSTLLYPLYLKWIPAYEATHKGVTITPGATGSGTGIADATAGTVQLGASDAYLSSAQKTPGMENIPLAISAQVVAYNLPGLNGRHLNINGAILAGIYTGKITMWNAPQIRQVNPGVKLPAKAIIPVRRSDASGDSFLFTSYMTDSASKIWTAGYSTSPNWPAVTKEVSMDGNGGMVQALKADPYSIAYVGISYLN
jgi:phosphate transport system substrate-binding protein